MSFRGVSVGRRWALVGLVVSLATGLYALEGSTAAHAQGGTVTNYTDSSIHFPNGFAAGPDGAQWFTNTGGNSIGRITTAGTVTNYTDSSISFPYGIAAGPDGALWFTNESNNSIGRITTTGTVTNYTGTGISAPQGIAAGPDGALWFANFNNNSIGRITITGTVTNYTGTGINNPHWIAAGPDGALWFTNTGSNSIGRITTTGTVTNYTGTGISTPYGIAAGPDGALWFTNESNNSIGRITTTGTVTNYTGTGISAPYGIAAGPDGALWFTNVSNNNIGRITITGTVTNYTGTGVIQSAGIAAGPDGALWFTNTGNDSIGRITPVGATVSNVAFMGSSAGPQIVVTGSGFGTAPPYPAYPAGCGFSGQNYGIDLYFKDLTANWTAGTLNPVGSGGACIGLVVTAWTDSQIVFGFGNAYNTNGWILNQGDSYSLTAFATAATGTASYFPAATVSLSPAGGPAGSAVVASGSSFSPGENVAVIYNTGLAAPTTVVLCIGIVAGDGSFTCYGHIPAAAQAGKAGNHKVTAKGFISGRSAKTHFTRT